MSTQAAAARNQKKIEWPHARMKRAEGFAAVRTTLCGKSPW